MNIGIPRCSSAVGSAFSPAVSKAQLQFFFFVSRSQMVSTTRAASQIFFSPVEVHLSPVFFLWFWTRAPCMVNISFFFSFGYLSPPLDRHTFSVNDFCP